MHRKALVRFLAIIIVVAAALLAAGCDSAATGGGSSADNGTVTTALSGAGDAPADAMLVAYVFAAGDTRMNEPDAVLALAIADIDGSGVAACCLESPDAGGAPSGSNWVGTAGEQYDLYVYTTADATDLDFDADTRLLDEFPKRIEIDGDYHLDVSFADMVANYLVVSLDSNPEAHNGEEFAIGVYPEAVDPETSPDAVLAEAVVEVARGEAFAVAQDVDGGTWAAADGGTYDVYAFVDMDDSRFQSNGDYQAHGNDPDGLGDLGDPYRITYPADGGNIRWDTSYDGSHTDDYYLVGAF